MLLREHYRRRGLDHELPLRVHLVEDLPMRSIEEGQVRQKERGDERVTKKSMVISIVNRT